MAWVAKPHDGINVKRLVAPENIWVGDVDGSFADLIVTAPELLDVARLLLRVDDEWKALSLDERTRVEAAIAKAEGL